MLKKVLAFLFFFIALTLSANEITTKANLENVKVFLGGAEITHTARTDLPPGVSEIIIENISNNINTSSLQVGGEGNFVILSVSSRKNFLKGKEKTDEIVMLEDSLKQLKNEVTKSENNIRVLNLQLDLLKANMKIGSETRGVTTTELKNMSDYFSSKSSELLTGISDAELKKKKLNERIEKINKQIEEINQKYKTPPTEIVVTVSAKQNTRANLDVSYITFDAGWNPSYDVRTADISSPLNLSLRANVWQNTGMDWKDVNIIVSTRSARQSNDKPELRRWFIDFIKDMQRAYGVNLKAEAPAKPMDAVQIDEEAESMANYMQVNETQLAVEYRPEIKYTIPTDGKPHIVALRDYEIPAEYEYYAAPKLDTDAFLVAYVEDWNQYNLLPGNANIYFENSFVGTAFVNPAITEEKMTFSLGRDKNINLKREVLEDFTEDKFLSSDIERFFGYEIIVKNNKNKEIKITVEDQVPVSKNENIEVKVQEISGAEYKKDTGILSWVLTLKPGETASKILTYSVRYPGDKKINLY